MKSQVLARQSDAADVVLLQRFDQNLKLYFLIELAGETEVYLVESLDLISLIRGVWLGVGDKKW